MSSGEDRRLDASTANATGGVTSSSAFRQQSSVGDAQATDRISSARFRIFTGFLGSGLSSPEALLPLNELDLAVLYAKTDLGGLRIQPQQWQRDNDPVFIWEPPAFAEVAGYSYAMDGTPDDTVETTATSFNVAAAIPSTLTDGRHTFSVKAINPAGSAGEPISFELWVDITPPTIIAYAPSAGALLNSPPTVSATLSDIHSGIDETATFLLINGGSTSLAIVPGTGAATATGGQWKEGTNKLELRVEDAAGNAQGSLIWSVTLDTIPPAGTVTINAGGAITTSLYVTLGMSASDATSGLARLLISNNELAGYVEEPYTAQRQLWRLNAVRGIQTVYVKFTDGAGNVSEPVSDSIELALLSPETVITSGPAGFVKEQAATFTFLCPEGGCVFSFAFDNDPWSEWSPVGSAAKTGLPFGNRYFRVKAAKDLNGIPGIQADEEDPSLAERTWIVGVEPLTVFIPRGAPIKLWRLE